jgi:hypothetical protein
VNWAIVNRKVCNEAVHEGGLPAKSLDHFQHIEDIARMLPIHRGDSLPPYSSAVSRTGRVMSVVKMSCAVEMSSAVPPLSEKRGGRNLGRVRYLHSPGS